MDKMLKELRISGEALARYCNVSGRTVHRWRHGECPVMVMDMLNSLLDSQRKIDAVRNA